MATACGLTRPYISNVEQATVNIPLANLEVLAAGLGCWPADLLLPLEAVRGSAPAAPVSPPSGASQRRACDSTLSAPVDPPGPRPAHRDFPMNTGIARPGIFH